MVTLINKKQNKKYAIITTKFEKIKLQICMTITALSYMFLQILNFKISDCVTVCMTVAVADIYIHSWASVSVGVAYRSVKQRTMSVTTQVTTKQTCFKFSAFGVKNH